MAASLIVLSRNLVRNHGALSSEYFCSRGIVGETFEIREVPYLPILLHLNWIEKKLARRKLLLRKSVFLKIIALPVIPAVF